MVKITIENKGNIQVDDGEVVLAFVLKADQETGDGETASPVSTHLCGEGSTIRILKNACMTLGSMPSRLYESQTSRAIAYSRMLDALRRGFEGEGIEVSDPDERDCGCGRCPMEEEDGEEDGKEAD